MATADDSAGVPTILIIGTADTKADELRFLRRCVRERGGEAIIMDVGVLGPPQLEVDYPNAAVATAAGLTIAAIIALGNENAAMTEMARGAVALTLDLHARGTIDGVLALGGTLGTDLALEVTAALPLGVPKVIVSTIAHSPLIPPERLAPDLMMVLWAGGLHGLNSICETILSQAAGAVVGACRGVRVRRSERPAVAIGSLGSSCLRYMLDLKPALEQRGYEAVVFHMTGMGGRALEALIDEGRFVAVFDLALQEVTNQVCGSVVNAGPTRMEAAVRRGLPQIVAPGSTDIIDVQTWMPMPRSYAGRPYHAHSRLLASVSSTLEERREIARHIASRLQQARSPVAFLLPLRGVQAWDRVGESLHDPVGLGVLIEEFRRHIRPPIEMRELDLHINDPGFVEAALEVFDRWVAAGHIPPGRPAAH
jgi:uncharacterized protein (UPF0261 family)